jgi:hypothetical protein
MYNKCDFSNWWGKDLADGARTIGSSFWRKMK